MRVQMLLDSVDVGQVALAWTVGQVVHLISSQCPVLWPLKAPSSCYHDKRQFLVFLWRTIVGMFR